MRNLKKVLALVIAFSMMLSAVAFAGYKDVAADADYAGAVELLSALGIFEGDETGNFNPDKTVTRAEMAAIICRAMGVDVAAQTATKFSDVPASHWASGYIAYASTTDDEEKNPPILNGVGGGKFNPSGTLTYQQALKMIVYALGFEPMAKDNGGWSAGSIYVANRYKLTEGADTTATRGNLAIILANAMSTPMMDKTPYGDDSKSEVLDGKKDKEYRTLLTDMDIYVATGMVKKVETGDVTFDLIEDSNDGAFVLDVNDTTGKKINPTTINDLVAGDSNIAEYKYNYVEAYAKKISKSKYEVVAVVPYAASETLTIVSDDIAAYDPTTEKLEYYVDAANSNKKKKIDVKKDIPVDYNFDDGAKGKTIANFDGAEDVVLTLIENPKTGDYCQVIAKKYNSCRVRDVDVDNDKLFLKHGDVKFDFDAIEDGEITRVLADEEGNALTLSDFAKDDVVAYIVAGDAKVSKADASYIEIIKLSNSALTGKVESTYPLNGKNYVVIDGQEYVDLVGGLDATSEGTFYIGMTGKIVDYDATTATDNYGYIVEGAIAKGSFSADQWQLKILTKEDGVVTYEIKDKYHDTVVKYLIDNCATFGLTLKYDVDDPNTTNVDESQNVIGFNEDKFLWEDIKDDPATTNVAEDQVAKAMDARFITFETDSNGEIKLLEKALVGVGTSTKAFAGAEYNADAQSINGANLEDDIVVFVVESDDIDDLKVADVSYLIDDGKYQGYAFRDKDLEYAAAVVTFSGVKYDVNAGFAVVTQVVTATNDEGDTVTQVYYVQNEEDGVLTLDYKGKSKCANTATNLELAMGDAFLFTADAKGLVSEFTIIARINKVITDPATGAYKITGFNVLDGFTNPANTAKLGEDTEIVSGFIYNDMYKENNGKQIIYLDPAKNTSMVVPVDAYMYTFNAAGRREKITVGDFLDDVEWCEAELDANEDPTGKYFVAPVLFRVVDGVVVDAYGLTVAQLK